MEKAGWSKGKELATTLIGGAMFIGQIVLCFLSHNWADLDVLLYIGWAMLAISWVLMAMTRDAFQKKGGAPEGERWLATTVLVDSGIYAVVRHRQCLSFIWLSLALVLISQHWLSVVLGIPIVVFLYSSMRGEERVNAEEFGDDYTRYMQSMPRMNALAGVIRPIQHRKNE